MILITGATGQLGKATIDFLIKNGTSPNEIAALARSEEKAKDLKEKGVNIRIGDYFNYQSLVAAFKDVDKVFFVSSSEINERTEQHKNVIEAAKEAGVNHIVYTSVERQLGSLPSPLEYVSGVVVETEKWIIESGIAYTILKNNLYMDIAPMFIGEKVLETGTIMVIKGDGKVGFALRTDMAEASANVLVSDGHKNKVYHFSNIEAYSYYDAAEYIKEITGKEITVIPLTADEYKDGLVSAGIPAGYVSYSVSFASAQAQGEFDTVSNDLERLLGRKPVGLKAYLETIYNSEQ